MVNRLPRQAAWRHVEARDGFEVTFVAAANAGLCFIATTSALEQARAWTVSYEASIEAVAGEGGGKDAADEVVSRARS